MSEPDSSLIAEFSARRSEDAFAALVRQHVNLVFATALRQVGDAGAAEDITQNVFVTLVRKAVSLGKKFILSCWLYQTARLTAANVVKSEIRRQRRAQQVYLTTNPPFASKWTVLAACCSGGNSPAGCR